MLNACTRRKNRDCCVLLWMGWRRQNIFYCKYCDTRYKRLFAKLHVLDRRPILLDNILGAWPSETFQNSATCTLVEMCESGYQTKTGKKHHFCGSSRNWIGMLGYFSLRREAEKKNNCFQFRLATSSGAFHPCIACTCDSSVYLIFKYIPYSPEYRSSSAISTDFNVSRGEVQTLSIHS